MKVHVGVDSDSGLVHSFAGTAANVSDVSQAHALLYGDEEDAFGVWRRQTRRDEGCDGEDGAWRPTRKDQSDTRRSAQGPGGRARTNLGTDSRAGRAYGSCV